VGSFVNLPVSFLTGKMKVITPAFPGAVGRMKRHDVHRTAKRYVQLMDAYFLFLT
jgi:hypothetical protein